MAKKPTLTLDDFYGDQAKLDKAQGIYDKAWDAANPAGTTVVNTQKPTPGRDQFGSMGDWAEYNRVYDNAWDKANPADRGINTELAEGIATGQIAPDQLSGNYNALAAQYLDKAAGMGDFSYDFNTDPLFKSLAHSYMKEARAAADDASALAASRTGGYGNSYGATAAGQQYNAALDDLYDRVPELQDAAYQRYLNQKNDYYTQAGYYNDLADQAYDRTKAEEETAYNRQLEAAMTAAQLGNYDLLEQMYGVNFDEARNADKLNQVLSILSAYGTENIGQAGALIQQIMTGGLSGNAGSGSGNGGTEANGGTGTQQTTQQTTYQPTESAGVMEIGGQQVVLPPSQTFNGTYKYYLGNDGKTLMYEFTDGYGNVHREPYQGILLGPDGTVVRQASGKTTTNYAPSYPAGMLAKSAAANPAGTQDADANANESTWWGQMLSGLGYVDPAVAQAVEEATPIYDANGKAITGYVGNLPRAVSNLFGTVMDTSAYDEPAAEQAAGSGGGSSGGTYKKSSGGSTGGGYTGDTGDSGGTKTKGNSAAPPAQSITKANTLPNVYNIDLETWKKMTGSK